MINLDTYIISDTHFGHANIVKYCDRPENHNELMEQNWWRTVSIDDNILHLGDVLWYKKTSEQIGTVQRLPGNKMLIKGNHDGRQNWWYEDLGFTIMPKRVFAKINHKTILFTHYPEDDTKIFWDINIHGHVHNNAPPFKEKGKRRWINVSVEYMDYTPVKLSTILSY